MTTPSDLPLVETRNIWLSTQDGQETPSWPKFKYAPRTPYLPLSELLTRHFDFDAHTAAYSVPSVDRRLAGEAPTQIPGGVQLVAFFGDIDCPKSHRSMGGDGTTRAPDAWWHTLAEKFDAMDQVHPGLYGHRGCGGGRLIYSLPASVTIDTPDSKEVWKRYHAGMLGYLARRFDLRLDPACCPWTNLYRLPFVRRNGEDLRLETFGDPHAIGVLVYDPSPSEYATDVEMVRVFAVAEKLTRTETQARAKAADLAGEEKIRVPSPAWGPALKRLLDTGLAMPLATRRHGAEIEGDVPSLHGTPSLPRVRRAPRVVVPRDLDAAELTSLAEDLGNLLRPLSQRHVLHRALAGAVLQRGVPLDRADALARAICAVSGETRDRPQTWRTTAARIANGQPFEGYKTLRAYWPEFADVLDVALPRDGGARTTRDDLDVLGVPDEVPALAAAEILRTTLRDAPDGPSVLRVTEGAGKTRAATDVAIERARALVDPRVPSQDRTVLVAESHDVALDMMARLATAGVHAVYRRSVLAVRDDAGKPVCTYHVPLSRLVRGGHSAIMVGCEGLGMGFNGAAAPCAHKKDCAAYAGGASHVNKIPGDSPRVFVTVHALLHEALEYAGEDALVLIDENPAPLVPHALTRTDLESAAVAPGFTAKERYRNVIVRAVAMGLEAGPVALDECALLDVLARGVAILQADVGWVAEARAGFPSVPDLEPAKLAADYALRVAYRMRRDPLGEPLGWIRRGAWAPHLVPAVHKRALTTGVVDPPIERASFVHALVARAFAGVVDAVPEGATRHHERALVHVEDEPLVVDPDDPPVDGAPTTRRVLRLLLAVPSVNAALQRPGPTVMLDATADLQVLGAVAGRDKTAAVIPSTVLRVADGAPVRRCLLHYSGASRRKALQHDALRFPVSKSGGVIGFPRYLAEALAMILAHTTVAAPRVALFTWLSLATQLEAAWAQTPGHDPRLATLLDPLRARGGTLHVGHYGALRGRNDWQDCDAYLSLGDARPNLSATLATARALDLLVEHDAIYRRATAAEASQAAGRMRAPWRTTPTIHVHVGTVAPQSWDARAEVLELPKGHLEMRDPVAVANAIRVHGSQRLAGLALGLLGRLRPRPTLATPPARVTPPIPGDGSVAAPEATEPSLFAFEGATPPSGPISDLFVAKHHARRYVERFGGVRRTARYLGIPNAVVTGWKHGTIRMPLCDAELLLPRIQASALPPPHARDEATPPALYLSGAPPPR